MKRLLSGLFLAISAFPAAFVAGLVFLQHIPSASIPEALGVAAKTAATVLGFAVFVFCSGLASKVEAPQMRSNGEVWSKDDQ